MRLGAARQQGRDRLGVLRACAFGHRGLDFGDAGGAHAVAACGRRKRPSALDPRGLVPTCRSRTRRTTWPSPSPPFGSSPAARPASGTRGEALALSLDVTEPSQIRDAVASAKRAFGRVDVLVNNAGYGYQASVEEGEEAEIRAQFDANVFGLFAMTQAILR